MLRTLSVLGSFALISVFAGCSSDDTGTAEEDGVSGDIRQSVTWTDGTKLTGVVRIFEGATVDIAPGARITCRESVKIQVGGTLRTKSSADKHASITCAKWQGIQVAQNGQLDLDGFDIENADTGIETTKGAGASTLTRGSILTTVRPFLIRAESKLTLNQVKATTPTTLGQFDTSVSEVFGSLDAKHLDYDANTNEGIMLKNGGEAVITDSILKATNGFDLVSTYDAKSLKLSYTTMRGSHCGPHIQGVDFLEIDHVTSEQNLYGITIYASKVDVPIKITNSNFSGSVAWLDLAGDHGPITFENVFTGAAPELIKNTDPPAAVLKVEAKVEGAEPRPIQ